MDNIEFLKQMLENYRQMMNLTMGLGDDPILKTEVRYEEESAKLILPEGEKGYRIGVIGVIIDGVVVTEVKKLLRDEETIEDIKLDLTDELLTGIFFLGIKILKHRKVSDFIKTMKEYPVTPEESLNKRVLMN